MKTFELFKENDCFGIHDENKMCLVYPIYGNSEFAIAEFIHYLRVNNSGRPFLDYSFTEQEIVEIENQLKNQQIV